MYLPDLLSLGACLGLACGSARVTPDDGALSIFLHQCIRTCWSVDRYFSLHIPCSNLAPCQVYRCGGFRARRVWIFCALLLAACTCHLQKTVCQAVELAPDLPPSHFPQHVLHTVCACSHTSTSRGHCSPVVLPQHCKGVWLFNVGC